MIEIVSTEFKDLRDLISASRSVSGVVIAYRCGEIRIYRGIAYIVTSLGRNHWYVMYTRNFKISDGAEAIEYTPTGDINEITLAEIGRDPKSIYFTVIRPVRDEIVEALLERVSGRPNT